MVRFWGSGQGAENLNPTIHEAFRGSADRRSRDDPSPPPSQPCTDACSGPGARPTRAPTPAPAPPIRPALGAGRRPMARDRRTETERAQHVCATSSTTPSGAAGVRRRSRRRQSVDEQRQGARTRLRRRRRWSSTRPKLADGLLPIDRDERRRRARTSRSRLGQPDRVLGRGAGRRSDCSASCEAADRGLGRPGQRSALLPPAGADDDPELARLAHALLAIAKALGISDAYKSDAASRIRALFAPAPARPDPDPRARCSASRCSVRRGRAHQSPEPSATAAATAAPRVLQPGRRQAPGPGPHQAATGRPGRERRGRLARSTPELVMNSVATLQARLESVDALHAEARAWFRIVSDLGGDLAEVAAELLAWSTSGPMPPPFPVESTRPTCRPLPRR